VSQNLDLVRSIYADWERGDWSSADWADPDIEFVLADGPEPSYSTGIAEMAAAWRTRLNVIEGIRVVAEEFHQLDDGRVLVLVRNIGQASMSGIEIDQLGDARVAAVFRVDGGRVASLVLYWEWRRALADLGLAPEDD
jgi:ketosteroid isomerase-like protein